MLRFVGSVAKSEDELKLGQNVEFSDEMMSVVDKHLCICMYTIAFFFVGYTNRKKRGATSVKQEISCPPRTLTQLCLCALGLERIANVRLSF